MSSYKLAEEEKFWNILMHLMNLASPIAMDDFCHELSIDRRELHLYLCFLEEVGHSIEQKMLDGRMQLYPSSEQKNSIKIEFSLIEWLMFQCHFPVMEKAKNRPYHDLLIPKLEEVEEENSNHEIFSPLLRLEEILNQNSRLQKATHLDQLSEMIQYLEESIAERVPVVLALSDRQVSVLPFKVINLENELTLIAENGEDQSLMSVPLKSITKMFEGDETIVSSHSIKEVENFMASMRAIADNEVRLILKIFSLENFNNSIKHEFVGNPCMVTNSNGDHIWAGTVAPSSAIYQWVEDLGSDIEIMEPQSFKKDFMEYCKERLKKIA